MWVRLPLEAFLIRVMSLVYIWAMRMTGWINIGAASKVDHQFPFRTLKLSTMSPWGDGVWMRKSLVNLLAWRCLIRQGNYRHFFCCKLWAQIPQQSGGDLDGIWTRISFYFLISVWDLRLWADWIRLSWSKINGFERTILFTPPLSSEVTIENAVQNYHF